MILFGLFAGAAALVIGLLLQLAPAYASDGPDPAQVVYSVALLAFIFTAVMLNWQGRFLTALRYGSIWILIGLVLVTAYAFRPEAEFVFKRIIGAVIPSKPVSHQAGEESFSKSQDGHYYIDAEVNGESVRFLVDTGASMSVLPTDEAERLGINVAGLSFNRPFATANGQVLGATIRLEEIRIGGIVRNDVAAAVVPNEGAALLGMSYFNTLEGFSFGNEILTLKD
jgi:aspartyl protease family protein